MIPDILRGSTSVKKQIFIQDSSSTTGAGLTGLAFGTSGLIAYYIRDGDATMTVINLVTATVGTWTSSGFKEVDATHGQGLYEIGIPDAALNSGNKVVLYFQGAANMVSCVLEIPLAAYNAQDAVRMGQTSLPNAAAEASGGLFTRGTGTGQINQEDNGYISVNLKSIIRTVLTETSSGYLSAGFKKLLDIAAPVFTLGSVNQTGDAYVRLGAPVGASISADVAGVQSDTDNIQTRLPAALVSGRMDSSVGAYPGNTAQTGDNYARIGAPVGASISADIAGVQSDTDNIQTRIPAALVSGRMDGSVGAYQTGQVPLQPTVAGNTLDVSSTGEAGLDFANIKQATGATTLNNIRVPSVTLVDTVTTYTGNTVQTGDSYARIGANGAGLTSVTLAASQSFDNAGQTTNLPANLKAILGTAITETAGLVAAAFSKFFNKAAPTGTVNSIPDAVAGAAGGVAIVGSNVGAATSVSGNVGGVASGGINAASFAAGAIDAAAIATDAIGANEFAAAAVAKIQAAILSDATPFAGAHIDENISAAKTLTSGERTALAAVFWNSLVAGFVTVGSIGKLIVDNLNATILSRMATFSYTAPDNTGIGNAATSAAAAASSAATAATQSTATNNKLGAFAATGLNTVLGFLRALGRKDAALTPSDMGGTYDNTTDSNEALRDRGDVAWTTGNTVAPDNAGILAAISAVPTATEIDTELSGAHGSGAWGSSGGTGPYTLTCQFVPAVEGIKASVVIGVTAYRATSDPTGLADFGGVIGGDYTLRAALSGYTYTPTTGTISDDTELSATLTAVVIPPPGEPGLCAVAFGFIDGSGQPIEGAVVTARLHETAIGTVSDALVSKQVLTATSDETGQAVLVFIRKGQFVPANSTNGVYYVTAANFGNKYVQAPNQSTAQFTDILNPD